MIDRPRAQVAATAFLSLFAIVGLALYGLPFYYDFMVKEFGWTRTQVTSGNAISKLLVGPLFGFFAGWIVDRFGPRRLMLAGILMAGGALAGVAFFVDRMEEGTAVMRDLGLRSEAVTPELYSYRGQSFCGLYEVILGGTFRFTPSGEDQRAVYDHYMRRRREKQPQGLCCGSVFKNPPNDHAGRLIEACGLKGLRRGGAVISPMHANFIMNEDNATFADVLGLIQAARDVVRGRFGVTLETEVRIIGGE